MGSYNALWTALRAGQMLSVTQGSERDRFILRGSPNSRVTEQNYLHIPDDSMEGAVLDISILAADMKRKWQQTATTERPPEGGLV
ncbi:MAG: hypothetical protein NTX73_11990 [Rhodobacterales bacterium]|nr:hypothetical protein [Rhodobacterales bacterium]